jgi:pyruvate/2-oxoglutarate/acetoin dehydrogenase E1 component
MAIVTYDEAVGNAIWMEMRRDPKIFALSSVYMCPIPGVPENKWEEMIAEFGQDRLVVSGISETQEAGAGIGAALAGMRPIVNLQNINFAVDAWGQLVSQAANIRFKLAMKKECPVIFYMSAGGKNSVHHSGCYYSWLANSPGLVVCMPSSPYDAVGLWRTALRDAIDPVVILSCGGVGSVKQDVPASDYKIPFGKADIKRQGADVTIAAVANMVNLALEAATDLAKEGIQAEVWDPRTLAPFDRESLVSSVKKTGAMVVVDQAPKLFGTTGEFAMTVAEAMDPVPPMARVATFDAPIGFGPILEAYVFPNKEKIISAVKGVLKRKRG